MYTRACTLDSKRREKKWRMVRRQAIAEDKKDGWKLKSALSFLSGKKKVLSDYFFCNIPNTMSDKHFKEDES